MCNKKLIVELTRDEQEAVISAHNNGINQISVDEMMNLIDVISKFKEQIESEKDWKYEKNV
ncbi:MAG: hypothetical protein OQK82_05080 [Candidatus Pacearchaeota archaeon]|nr:hypothetical protein [Candidatus Pacearchaeota archaeon]